MHFNKGAICHRSIRKPGEEKGDGLKREDFAGCPEHVSFAVVSSGSRSCPWPRRGLCTHMASPSVTLRVVARPGAG